MPRIRLPIGDEIIPDRTRRNRQNRNQQQQPLVVRMFLRLWSMGAKPFIYSVAILLGLALGTTLGLGFMMTLALAVATPIAMELGNVLTNSILNFIIPSTPPRTWRNSSNALVMTLALFFNLSVGLTFGLSFSWMAGIFFLAPLVVRTGFHITLRTIEYLFPAIRNIRLELQQHQREAANNNLLELLRDPNNNTIALTYLNALRDADVEIMMRALQQSIHYNNLEAFNNLVTRPQVSRLLNRDNNRLLISACFEGRTDMVTALLRNRHVRNTATINNNEALRYACREGHLDIVEALLEIRNVRHAATYNHCEARRLAVAGEHQAIAQRLLRIPAVANHIVPEGVELTITLAPGTPLAAPDHDALRNLARQRENAMNPLSTAQAQALESMRTRYQATLNQRGRDSILEEVRRYLVAEYNRKPATHNGRSLPLDYVASLSNAEKNAYHQHKIHTAYRGLFLAPNPWAAGQQSAYFSNTNLDIVCFNWLAANDTNQELPEGFTRRRIKKQFADIIYQIERAHNWDNTRINRLGRFEEYDDGYADRPSCGAGVTQRLMQFVTLFLNNNPQTRPLSATIIKAKFKEELIAEGENNHSLFSKLNALSKKDLNSYDKAFDDWCNEEYCDKDKLTAELRRMEPSAAQINAFVDQCKNYFGTERITNTGQNISYQGRHFDTYELYIRELARNTLTEFAAEINEKIQALKNPKKNKASSKNSSKDKSKNKSKAPLTFSERSKAHTSRRKDKDKDKDKDKENHAPKRNHGNKSTTYHPRPRAIRT